MPSTPRRKPVITRLAAPLLALLAGACADPPATGETDTGSGSSGTATQTEPTTDPTVDDSGVPVEGEARYFVRIDDSAPPPVVLDMDKAKVLEVFGEAAARKIKLLDVETTILLGNVLDAIQNACGNRWRLDSPTPMHDCKNPQYIDWDGETAAELKAKYGDLGKSFPAAWQTSPEFAMVRLLSMTAANADVSGTALQRAAQYIADNPDVLKITFKSLLAQSLGIPVTEAFIPRDKLILALQQTLIASHPASTRAAMDEAVGDPAGKLPVTLYDAIMDMQPLADKFAAADDHPGILLPDDEDFTTTSDALTPAFRMKAIAESNLRLVEGVDASLGAGSMFLAVPPGGQPGPASPLNFDFLDPEKVQMLGIADAPTVDMRMSITELSERIQPCAGTDACKKNYPETPVGDEYIWSTPQWSLERIIGTAGYFAYEDRAYEQCFIKDGLLCDAGVWIGPSKIALKLSNPPGPIGWTQFKVLDKQVPAPQFLWEMFLEIAQVAIHDPIGNDDFALPTANKADNIAEGDAKPVYALKGVGIGLTAEEMIAQIRPNLQEQADFIAGVILGKYWTHNANLDFYYRRVAADAPPVLFFVHESDPRPDATGDALAPYGYKKPGFFADAALTEKLSSTTVDGVPEAEHEKFKLPEGETTLYIQDDEDQIYRLRFFVPAGGDPTEIVVHVRAV